MERQNSASKWKKVIFFFVFIKKNTEAAFSSQMKRRWNRKYSEMKMPVRRTASETVLTCFYVQLFVRLVVCRLKGG